MTAAWLTLLLFYLPIASAISAQLSYSSASRITSFCKCICNSNSTIIPLLHPSNPSNPCNDCNRQFCLNYQLPFCTDVEAEAITTKCFQRDSLKDKLVVYLFIFVTSGLLIWAAVRPWAQKYIDAAQDRARPTPAYAVLPN
ncbi:hypothetical protein SAICODRAFT_30028 [Saitoella complicata NRRL Y-17804]|uniref:Uncharacterized protein n=1 Tax=Saitoella complicata (strain BCRC 22490 / CBS 7301 / JCM 7358 / NBRC 10748 / NRRL Y-17804) TaxID=698492 RepID=A0A0E9NM69_SAICN|nr:uncharacterized protein SAICODRAFT_30028 [Saitoella complicata NRRL Y-17804]ODQ53704.1 hypothetical protein SAICODRAFT_30028 [Saitoella complicata NRRL Y-17804]GAO50883.1 hypothetical protein G7K_5002-t1 [Saitoella complicata NRRL Y-17804]